MSEEEDAEIYSKCEMIEVENFNPMNFMTSYDMSKKFPSKRAANPAETTVIRS